MPNEPSTVSTRDRVLGAAFVIVTAIATFKLLGPAASLLSLGLFVSYLIWIAGQWRKDAAAVLPLYLVGISDKVSKAGTTDIADEEYLVHARHRPWDNWQLFLERSPIYHAGKARTPTLILGGMDDPRVHPGQSMEMYRHLKVRSKVPVRLVRYPGEQHGNRRAASRLDYSLRLMQWMDHYLKGPGGAPPPYDIDYGPPK